MNQAAQRILDAKDISIDFNVQQKPVSIADLLERGVLMCPLYDDWKTIIWEVDGREQ